ncbi:MAG TPA: Crp/Fnr family transcriptional regulator [Aggregatilineales bacterium]|nr:Crp/Fnr family transcriptional regulator [Aggregatilineales bacterium]
MLDEGTLGKAKAALTQVSYFAKLDADLARLISQQMQNREYAAGQIVFLEGDQNVALYIVDSGWLKAVKSSPDGREQILHFIGSGEVFNAIGVFASDYNPATVIALEPSSVWVIEQKHVLDLFDLHPELGKFVIRELAGRVQQLIQMVEDLSLRTIEARLARYLLEQSDQELLARPRWATQAEIANRLGTVPDVLNRALRSLARENLILVERHQIQILDQAGLKSKAGLDR